MNDEDGFLTPEEMSPSDWAVFDKTGLPPRRKESATAMKADLAAAGWATDAPDPIAEAEADAERERLGSMTPDEHLQDLRRSREGR